MNLFELFIKIGVDDQASGKLSNLSSKLGNGLKTAAKIGTAAVGTAAAGIAALTKSAVEGFAEYEQLAGGAQKIFDQMDYSKIEQDAQNAYKTMNISASQYLATMNDVGATFAATMGDEAGYNAAKTGLQAIADYASGTGKSVDALSEKFTMITRSTSSYQSIADQFSGILPATSNDFLAQAQAAGILSDSYTQLTQVPIAEYQQAVSEMLEKGVEDLGLAGNTAAETATTISGSLNAAKSAWENLVTGLGDANADIDVLLDNFLDSVETVGKNLLPVVERILAGLFTTLEERGPDMIAEGVLLLGKLAVGLITGIPDLIRKIPEIIKKIVSAFTERSSEFKGIGKNIVQGIWDGIVSLATWIENKVSNFFSGIVDGVKGVLGIHSPSRVFAGIGENMALGLGKGWEDEFGSIKKGIENGMDFGVANIDVGASMLGRNSSALNSAFSNFAANLEQNTTIIVQSVLDGRVIGETAYQYSRTKAKAYGV